MSSPDAISLLRTQSLTTLVHEELEQRIAAGRLLPGTPLRESAIATDMGISRGPVREAFRMLEERGLVMFEKNCGVRVRQLDLEQATHIYQVRIPLEGLIGELVTQNLSSDATNQVRLVLEEMAERVAHQDVPAYTDLNFRFHDLLAKFTGNPALYDTYRRLVVQLKLFRSYTFRHSPETIGVSLREHTAIFEAIVSLNVLLAGELLRQHAKDSLQRLRAVAQPS
ncbi:GntR family transcriptional regulator [Stutzerimonas kirkiae]|uniref:GntR family transcriptional regulator n=2 Tax=Stutzerimonas kirkiae TaxID=2211392 RepID=A0A4Q9RGH4_9GAMM|nr:FCD domain-containing protein [Stutzerimonas kirkiae]TBU99995.1 GntR family transcriptional regulator [Stutzerimonas kirkiae]TBV05701.1 GntR family transcriptional regulator [Stutzerimonas kirkiae]TBV10660.1 GntR family transcriptional regulator [Stutzerimonas kirkiae]TBV17615.1 GntR family transcriptional regulator [Stutzerimonas kirkiae]